MPLLDLDRLKAFPPAARDREITKAANTFASTGRNMFVHWTEPVLAYRRARLQASGATRKKFFKTVAQLWFLLEPQDIAFWNDKARNLRADIRNKLVTHEQCVLDAGQLQEHSEYHRFAEKAVAQYLQLSAVEESLSGGGEPKVGAGAAISDLKINTAIPLIDPITSAASTGGGVPPAYLLDTLPDRFTVTPPMMYSHFARYDFDFVQHHPEGKRRAALLRQIAKRLDKTGKVLFYFYVYPHLWKMLRPIDVGETVASAAQESWRFLCENDRELWETASAEVKKMLGDGDVLGLERMRLDGLDPEVLRLHEMARKAVRGFKRDEPTK